jgi:hypothetical protein
MPFLMQEDVQNAVALGGALSAGRAKARKIQEAL